MRERRTHGSVRGLRREPLVYSTVELNNSGLFISNFYDAIFNDNGTQK